MVVFTDAEWLQYINKDKGRRTLNCLSHSYSGWPG